VAKVILKDVMKQYDNNSSFAVDKFCMDIADKEFVVLVGPSGCGKSTVLRMIAGLEDLNGGEIYIGDKLVNEVEPKDRDIAMVFQNYALYPHMTVYENIAFGLRMRKEPRAEIDKKVRRAAEILEISHLLDRKPKALSGGQRQRVAIGRAIVRIPAVFLMDEPLSNLDALLRTQMRTELIKLRKELNTTFIYVTHDQSEAMTLGDRICVMNDGHIMQIGTPAEVFNKPENLFVAKFIGIPQMNTFDGVIYKEEKVYYAKALGTKFPVGIDETVLDTENMTGRKVTIGIRPEHLVVSDTGELTGEVIVAELMGSTMNLHVKIDSLELIIVIPTPDIPIKAGSIIKFAVDETKVHVFDRETQIRLFR